VTGLLLFLALSITPARGEDSSDQVQGPASSAPSEFSDEDIETPELAKRTSGKPKKTGKLSQGRNVRERETDGTTAPNRFESTTVIKSRYQLNGEYLEVDPD